MTVFRSGASELDSRLTRALAAQDRRDRLGQRCAWLDSQRIEVLDRRTALRERKASRQNERESLKRFGLSRIVALVIGHLDDRRLAGELELVDVELQLVTTDAELAELDRELEEVRDELATLTGVAADIELLLTDKAQWLAAFEDHPSLPAIEASQAAQTRWQRFRSELDDVIGAGARVQEQVLQAIVYYEDATDPRSRFRGSEGSSGSKAGQIAQAAAHAAHADRLWKLLAVEVEQLIPVYRDLEIELPESFTRIVQPVSIASLDELRREGEMLAAALERAHRDRTLAATKIEELGRRRRQLLIEA